MKNNNVGAITVVAGVLAATLGASGAYMVTKEKNDFRGCLQVNRLLWLGFSRIIIFLMGEKR